jgi:hypothetical protein
MIDNVQKHNICMDSLCEHVVVNTHENIMRTRMHAHYINNIVLYITDLSLFMALYMEGVTACPHRWTYATRWEPLVTVFPFLCPDVGRHL